jgi:hypothetical protein
MEDRRITKTKRALKSTLKELMCEKPIRNITVKEICDEASTSRITFYTYYDDKYSLLEDMITDSSENIARTFYRLQAENNPDDDLVLHCQNLVDATISVQIRDDIIQIMSKQIDNVEIAFYYYTHVCDSIYSIEKEQEKKWSGRYSISTLTSFFVAGFCGCVVHAVKKGDDLEKMRKDLKDMMKDILEGNLVNADRK